MKKVSYIWLGPSSILSECILSVRNCIVSFSKEMHVVKVLSLRIHILVSRN